MGHHFLGMLTRCQIRMMSKITKRKRPTPMMICSPVIRVLLSPPLPLAGPVPVVDVGVLAVAEGVGVTVEMVKSVLQV